jgi:cyclase
MGALPQSATDDPICASPRRITSPTEHVSLECTHNDPDRPPRSCCCDMASAAFLPLRAYVNPEWWRDAHPRIPKMTVAQSRHYTFQEVGDGIHAAIARPEGNGVCNSGIVDLGGAALVFDTSLTPGSGRDLRVATEATLGQPPTVAANSHWHLDHSLGNQEFSSVPIWGTRRTREILLEKHDQLMAALTRGGIENDLRELEAKRQVVRSEDARRDLEFVIQINRAILSEVETLRLIPPDHTFETRLPLPGRRGAELICFGSGHTEADAILLLPREKVVYGGDLVVVGVQPSMDSGDPEHWLVVLDEIERLGAQRIVPGHGPVVGSEGMQEIRGYVSGVLEAAAASDSAALPLELRRWEGSLSLEENLRFTRGWMAAHPARR